MKVARLHRFGGPEVLEYDDVTPPTPKPGEALVKTEAIGVNYTDVNGVLFNKEIGYYFSAEI